MAYRRAALKLTPTRINLVLRRANEISNLRMVFAMSRTVRKDPNLKPGKPIKPGNLSKRASAEWDRLMGELQAAGIQISTAHRALVSLAATIAADIVDAWEAIERDGAYVESKTGLVAHPASKRLDALRRDKIKVLAMLGLRAAVAEEDKGKARTLAEALAD